MVKDMMLCLHGVVSCLVQGVQLVHHGKQNLTHFVTARGANSLEAKTGRAYEMHDSLLMTDTIRRQTRHTHQAAMTITNLSSTCKLDGISQLVRG